MMFNPKAENSDSDSDSDTDSSNSNQRAKMTNKQLEAEINQINDEVMAEVNLDQLKDE
jgi:hypothetical protein